MINKIIEFLKKLFNINNVKQIPESTTVSSTDKVETDIVGTNKVEIDNISNTKASNNQNEIDSRMVITEERDFSMKEIIHFDDELLMLAREYEKLKKEYLKEKAEIEKLNSKIENLEKNNTNKS